MGMKPETTLVPLILSSKGTRIIDAIDRIAADNDIEIIRDDMAFDDEHIIIDLSAILKLVTKLVANDPEDEYVFRSSNAHLLEVTEQLKLF